MVNRADIFASLLRHFRAQASGYAVLLPTIPAPTENINTWFVWRPVSYAPARAQTGDLWAPGTVRVTCHTRAGPKGSTYDTALPAKWVPMASTTTCTNFAGSAGPKGSTYDTALPAKLVQVVVDAIGTQEVAIRDYVSGSGTTVVAHAQFQEVQDDALGVDPQDGVQTTICTVEFFVR